MAKPFAEAFYHSKSWKDSRKAYIAYRISIDGGMCEDCHTELGYIVHHKIELTPENINDPDIALSFDNYEYVCKACHDRKDNHFIKPVKKRYKFDKYGNVIPIDKER